MSISPSSPSAPSKPPLSSSTPVVHSNDRPEQYHHTLANGLTLVAERIPGVQSAAMNLLVPAGASSDPETASGAASVLSDWILRGAGKRDSREITGYLDGLGVQRSTTAENMFLRFSAVMLGKNLLRVLPVYGDMVIAPHLPDDGFEPSKDLALQQLDAIEDEPSHKLSLMMRERHFPFPYGRPSSGKADELEALTAEGARADAKRRLTPHNTILSIAGMFNWNDLVKAVEDGFGHWKGEAPLKLVDKPAPRGITHIQQETNQSQIGLAWDAVKESDPDSILLQAALNVLSGGMGARLFTEIREKQGLCYTVQAGYASLKQAGAVFGYAGTSPDRAQRTLDSFIVELQRFAKGITADELERALIGMKSRVIMQGDSSGARAGALASDFYHRARTRTLDELRERIDSVTLSKVNTFLESHPVKQLTVVTIGPAELQVNL